MLRIVSAAIIWKDMIFSMPAPHRHHHILLKMRNEMGLPIESVSWKGQGFLTSEGNFVNRKEAELIAFAAGQMKYSKIIGGILTSEDLW